MSLTYQVLHFKYRKSKMNVPVLLRHQVILIFVLLCFFSRVDGLKCRTATESQQSNDFEYVVRMCLRHMRNESDIYDLYKLQSDYDSGKNKRYRDEMSGDNSNSNSNSNNNNENRHYYGRNRGYPEGFDRFWPSGNNRNRYNDEGDFDDSDYYNSRNSKEGKKKFKGRPPHSYQQQLQHDRDVWYGRGNREPNYFYSNRNKNKFMFNKDKNNDSPLNDIDPCVIHCIFQEMQMVDDNGKPNKGLISQKMTQKIRNSELKNFIQNSVDECFDVIDDDDDFGMSYNSNNNNNNNNNRYRKPDGTCDWAKTFALCLEDRGRENCDDWNEPVQKNHNNSRNEDQRHKSKQNDRG